MDDIDKSLIDGTIELKKTLNEITKKMNKQEIVNQIIESIENNQDVSSDKEKGIIFSTIGPRIIKYFIALKELWQMPTKDIQDCDLMRNLPKKLGSFHVINNETVLISNISELELIVILDELKTDLNLKDK